MPDANYILNADPMKFLLEYKEYLEGVKYHLTGYHMKEIPKMKKKRYKDENGKMITEEVPDVIETSDGQLIENFVWDEVKDPNVDPICNLEGGNYVVQQFSKYLNKYCAMGDLNRDDIAVIAGDAVKETYDYLLAYGRTRYNVKNLSLLKADGAANFNSLYMYFTALKDGELKRQILGMMTAGYNVQQSGPMNTLQQPSRSLFGIGKSNAEQR